LKIKKFNQIITPDAKCEVSIELINNKIALDKELFFKTYKISKIFKGKYFIKRLIKKVFNHQLKNQFIWCDNFWDKIFIHQYSTQITYINPCKYNEMCIQLKSSTKKNRMKDILKYKNLILDGCDLNNPLFITSKALNFLGGDTNDSMLILDGSRRLVANILAEINPNVLIIDIKL